MADFELNKSFIIVRSSTLSYDDLVNKTDDAHYTAILMQCTHYDNPVFANNKEIFCPSHGSKFDFSGKVKIEPANVNLKSYRTELKENTITIFLK